MEAGTGTRRGPPSGSRSGSRDGRAYGGGVTGASGVNGVNGAGGAGGPEGAAGASGTGTAGLLLAAGGGRRLGGRPKALLPYRGGLLVEAAAAALREAGCDQVVVVIGAGAEEVRRRARLDGCTLAENQRWASGMGSSLRAGLAAVADDTAAVLVCLVDQPGIGAAALARVRRADRGPDALAAATYRGRRGHPVLIGAAHRPRVAELAQGDQGARRYLREHEAEITLVECADIASDDDLDTPDDLHLLERNQPGPKGVGKFS